MGGKKAMDMSPEDELGQLIAGASGTDESTPEEELAGILASSKTPPQAPPAPQSMFTEPDPSMKAPDARGTLERLVDRDGTLEQAIADAGGDPIKGMVNAHGGADSMLEEFLGMMSPVGSEARATEEAAKGFVALAKRVAARTAEGAAFGGAQRATEAARTGADNSQILDEFVHGLPIGAAFGFGGSALGETAGMIGNKVAQSSEAAANSTLLRSTGMSSKEIQKLSPEERAAAAQKLRDSGITKGIPTLGTINQRATDYAKAGGERMAVNENAINALEQPPAVPVADLIAEQRAKAARESSLAPIAKRSAASFRAEQANNLEQDTLRTASRQMTDEQRFQMLSKGYQPATYFAHDMAWDRALEQRRAFDDVTNFGPTNQSESTQNAINKEFGGGLRDRIDSSLNAPNVPPELAQGWRSGRDQYSLGSEVAENSLNAMPNASVGTGSLGGQAMGWLGRNAGMSALSKGLSGVSWMGDAAERGGLSMSNEAGRIGQLVAGLSATEQLQQLQSQSRGQRQPDTVEALLQQPPPWLQQYAPQLQQALQNGKLNEELSKLRNTDDNWKRNVLPQLQMMTAQGAQ